MTAIHPLLFAVDVVGPGDVPARLLQSEAHQANAGEELGHRAILFGSSILHGFVCATALWLASADNARENFIIGVQGGSCAGSTA